MPSTDLAYGAIQQPARRYAAAPCLRARYAMLGTDPQHVVLCATLCECPVLTQRFAKPGAFDIPTNKDCEAKVPRSLSSYARATRCPATLISAYAMSGTDVGYAATRHVSTSEYMRMVRQAMTGTAVAYAAAVRACYAISSTEKVHATMGLRAPYAIPGTDVASGDTTRRI
eukprot:1812705-Rhodomonas_salina.1